MKFQYDIDKYGSALYSFSKKTDSKKPKNGFKPKTGNAEVVTPRTQGP